MKKYGSYLSTLRFDKKLGSSLQARYIPQIRLVSILIVAIVAIGTFAYFTIPKRLNPQINIPIVTVSTVLPGASPEDTEQLITIPLEDKIENVKNIDSVVSSSREGVSAITIQFISGVNKDRARDDVKSAVDSVNDLPTEAKTPSVQALDFEDQPIWTFAVTGHHDPVSLKRFSENLKDRIETSTKIDRVATSGLDEQNIEVVIHTEKVREYGISPFALSQTIQKFSSSYPSGNVQTLSSSFTLTIDRDIANVDDIRNLRITIHNQPIRLGDVAKVFYKSLENQPKTLYASRTTAPTESIQFFVFKSENANIDAAEEEAQKIVDETVKEYNNSFSITTVNNSAEEIITQFNDLARDFFFTILLVFILLLIFLGLKQAAIASITVPLTLLSSFAIINALGLTLNFLTAFAFLIALGLLIDDTIVVVAAMTRYYATGRFTPVQTGILVWKDFIVPLWSTTITTIWAFVPLLLSTGIIGEFIKTIPIVVTATMLSSTTIAVLITLPLMTVFLKPQIPKRVQLFFAALFIVSIIASAVYFLPKNIFSPFIGILLLVLILFVIKQRQFFYEKLTETTRKNQIWKKTYPVFRRVVQKGVLDIEWISVRYTRIIDRILTSRHGKRNTLIAIAIFAVIAYLLIPLGIVTNEFFPKQDVNLLYVNVTLPPGTSIDHSNLELFSMMENMRSTEETTFIVGEAGQKFGGQQGRSSDQNAFVVTIHLTDIKKRTLTSQEIAEIIRDRYKSFSKGTLSVVELSGGPPAGADAQITLLGDDLSQLDTYADTIMTFLQKRPGLTNVDKSIKSGTSKIVFRPDKEKLAAEGLTIETIALWLRTYASGFTLDTIKLESEDEDIVFKTTEKTATPEDLTAISIPTQRGTSVPLLSLGTFTLAPNPTVITRESGKRTISVFASVRPGASIPEENKALEEYVKTLKLPAGYSWKTGGVNEENQKSVNSIFQAMIISFLLILITMVIEFRSYRQTGIALMIIPLSVAGVLYIFALTNTPLSFPALIGILALFGIVVTHAIVVIEKINDNVREKLPLKEAIVDAAGSRLEPVLLTSLATIVGLTPITLSDPLWRGLGGAIIAGLVFSGAIKLFFVPVMYYLFFNPQKKRR